MNGSIDLFGRSIQLFPLKRYPFPHRKLSEVFSATTYSRMLSHWPSDNNFTPFSDTGRVPKGPSDSRCVFVLNSQRHIDDNSEMAEFWREFYRTFAGFEEKSSLIKSIEPYISTDDAKQIKLEGLDVDILLMRDRAGYSLPPHTDAPYKLFTLLIYCGDYVELPGFDTIIYETSDQSLLGAREVHHDRMNFREVDRVKFKSNNGFFFLRTDNSFHGVEAVPATDIQRDLIMVTGYIGGFPERFNF